MRRANSKSRNGWCCVEPRAVRRPAGFVGATRRAAPTPPCRSRRGPSRAAGSRGRSTSWMKRCASSVSQKKSDDICVRLRKRASLSRSDASACFRCRNWPTWLPMTREAASRRWSGSRAFRLEKLSTPMVLPSATTAKANPPRRPVPGQTLRSRTRGSRVMSGDQTGSPRLPHRAGQAFARPEDEGARALDERRDRGVGASPSASWKRSTSGRRRGSSGRRRSPRLRTPRGSRSSGRRRRPRRRRAGARPRARAAASARRASRR